ncbi:MAG: EamA family transporter [Bacteroidetes bacterium]|nr:EamA family transporter [Bacteroidota bacterium]MDA1121550.1 EamA family transporter [Bacteroidota bacterium]
MKAETKDHLELHFLVIIWSFTGILGLVIKVSPQEVVFYRTLISVALLSIILLVIRQKLAISGAHLIRLLAGGFLFAGHWILFFASARVSNISICLVGMATMALWASIIEPLVEGRKVSTLNVFLSMIAMVGISIIYHFEFDSAMGLMLALLSALMGAIGMILNKNLVKSMNPFKIMFYEMGSASGLSLIFIVIFSKSMTGSVQIQFPDEFDVLYLFILAGLCTVYAYSMSIKLMKRMTAFTVSFAVNLEPVYGILLALLIFGEKEYMDIGFYFGAVLILMSVFSYPYLSKMKRVSFFKN